MGGWERKKKKKNRTFLWPLLSPGILNPCHSWTSKHFSPDLGEKLDFQRAGSPSLSLSRIYFQPTCGAYKVSRKYYQTKYDKRGRAITKGESNEDRGGAEIFFERVNEPRGIRVTTCWNNDPTTKNDPRGGSNFRSSFHPSIGRHSLDTQRRDSNCLHLSERTEMASWFSALCCKIN